MVTPVTPVHKNTNAPLGLIVCDVIFCMLVFRGGPDYFDPKIARPCFAGNNLGFKKFLAPAKTPRNRRLCVLPA
jgi:hypothetical protein